MTTWLWSSSPQGDPTGLNAEPDPGNAQGMLAWIGQHPCELLLKALVLPPKAAGASTRKLQQELLG